MKPVGIPSIVAFFLLGAYHSNWTIGHTEEQPDKPRAVVQARTVPLTEIWSSVRQKRLETHYRRKGCDPFAQ